MLRRLLTRLILVGAVAASLLNLPSSSTNLSTIGTVSLTNTSLLGVRVDPSFTLTTEYMHRLLIPKALYMNALAGMVTLSTKDWLSASDGIRFSYAPYDRVEILLVPPASGSKLLQYRFAVWGLWQAIYNIGNHGFQAAALRLFWEEEAVGDIFLQPTRNHRKSKLSASDTTQPAYNVNDVSNISDILPLDNTNASNINLASPELKATTNSALKVDVTLNGAPLATRETFVCILSALADIAQWPTHSPVDGGSYIYQDPEHNVQVMFQRNITALPKDPDLQFGHAARALAKMPYMMYQQDHFEEASFVVRIDEIQVGEGWLKNMHASTAVVASEKA